MNNHLLNYLKFVILRPSGNDTALISGIIRETKERKRIADLVQQIYPNVEQVGFVNYEPGNAELMMTGGEFCGNATSSAAYHLLAGKPGEIKIKVSGVKNRISAGVTKNGEGFSQMPVYPDPSYIKQDPTHPGNFLVVMEGITHYVDFDISQIRGLTELEIKTKARNKMQTLGIDKNAACGIIYARPINNKQSLKFSLSSNYKWMICPVVYVRDADTLYLETACASGTTALGLILAQRNSKSIKEMSVKQPSGLTIKVSVEFNSILFGYVQIQSYIKKIDQGILEFNPYSTILSKLLSRLSINHPFSFRTH